MNCFLFGPLCALQFCLTGGFLTVSYRSSDFDRRSLRGAVIQITAPYCASKFGVCIPAVLAPVVAMAETWPHNYSWPAQRPLRPVYPQLPGSVRVSLGPGGAPLGFWIRASAWGLPDPRLVHPGPCPRGPLVRPGVRLSRSRPTLGGVTGPGSLHNGSRP